jgi:citrate lyase subunit beta/citryl-CoA lyase
MSFLIRRSNLLVSMTDPIALRDAWRHRADAITLDPRGKDALRAQVKDAIPIAAKGGAEVFVRSSAGQAQANIDAAVWPGLTGLMLSPAQSAEEIQRADTQVSALEAARGLAAGSVKFILSIETARAVWDVRALIKASARVQQVALDERALAANLGFTPLPELDPFDYARGRVVVECTAAKVAPVGMAYPLSVAPCELADTACHEIATKAKNLGMKGVICPYASWVVPVNAAFTPTPELVEWNRRVREAFAKGVAEGTAAVPLDGKMIDVPVDEWAIVVLAMAEACAKRDAQKQAALARGA